MKIRDAIAILSHAIIISQNCTVTRENIAMFQTNNMIEYEPRKKTSNVQDLIIHFHDSTSEISA